MRQFVFILLIVCCAFIFANPQCPENVPPQGGYLTIGNGFNISHRIIGKYYAQSISKLAAIVETVTEAENPGWDLVLNTPTDGSYAPICFKLYINGKIWPEYDTINSKQRCGASFNPTGLNFNYAPTRLFCPIGYTLQNGRCVTQNPKLTLCPLEEKSIGQQDCCVGNPIYPPTGNKFETEIDYQSPGPYPFTWIRYYNSGWPDVSRLGQQWRHNFDRHITFLPLAYPEYRSRKVLLERPDGKRLVFKEISAGQYASEDAALGIFMRLANGEFQFFDRLEQVTEYYDTSGKLKSLVYLGGYIQTLEYDREQLTTIHDTFHRTITLTYDNEKRIIKIQTPGEHFYQYTYDPENRLIEVIYPDGASRRYHYGVKEAPHLLTGITNEVGIRYASWNYNEQGRAETSNHPLFSETTAIHYNDKQGVRLVWDPKGAFCRYEYITLFGKAKLSKIGGSKCAMCPQGATWTYDTKGFLTQFVNCQGLTTDYTRDVFGRETTRIEAPGTSQERAIKTTWHTHFNLPLHIEEPLRTTIFGYNDMGLLLSKTETIGTESRTWRYRYNSKGLLLEQDGPREDVLDITRFEYDDVGKLLSIQNPIGQTVQIRAHDAEGRPTFVIDENGLEKNMIYDVRGRLVTLREGIRTTAFTYNAVGKLVEVTHPNGTKTKYTYDAANRLILETDPAGFQYRFSYDMLNYITDARLLDSQGNLILQKQWTYDSRLLPNQSINGLGHINQWSYDLRGYPTQFISSLSAVTHYEHDVFGRQTRMQDALGGITTWVYNPQNQLVQLQDPNHQTTIWTRNGFGEVKSEHNPSRGLTTYLYDKASNPVAITNALGKTIQTTYDALNRPIQISSPEETSRFAYEEGKNHLAAVHHAHGNILYTHDIFGQLLSQTDTICLNQPCNSFKQNYQYDSMGRVHSMQYPSGHILNFIHTTQGEITGITLQMGQKDFLIAKDILHSPLNRWKTLTLGNNIVLERHFDLNGNLISEEASNQKTEYTYDAHNNLLSLLNNSGQQAFGYDLLSRLTNDQGTVMTYDNHGNRLSPKKASVSYNSAGQLIQKNTLRFEHDTLGRLQSIHEGNTKKAEYAYNPFHLRVAKIYPRTSQRVYFMYTPNGQLLAEYNEHLELLREYYYFQNEPIAVFTQNKLYYLQTDVLGTPKLATDSHQQIVWSLNTTAFGEGKPTMDTIEIPLRFPGQYYDTESGLHYNWHRYYDPEIGQYIEPDPIGIDGGVNLYTYANNNPLKFVDPEGLDWIYSQSTGNMYHQPDNGLRVLVGRGYAGHGTGLNNSASQYVPGGTRNSNAGPIPQGRYTIGELGNNVTRGRRRRILPDSMRLYPNPNNNMFDRSGFLIHGGNMRIRNSSQGCIVLPQDIRNIIGNSNDETLVVVP